jgi:hypothetical protein
MSFSIVYRQITSMVNANVDLGGPEILESIERFTSDKDGNSFRREWGTRCSCMGWRPCHRPTIIPFCFLDLYRILYSTLHIHRLFTGL